MKVRQKKERPAFGTHGRRDVSETNRAPDELQIRIAFLLREVCKSLGSIEKLLREQQSLHFTFNGSSRS
jgi:hypothetical protein